MRQRQGAQFCSILNAGVRQAPSEWMRRRKGAKTGSVTLALPLRWRLTAAGVEKVAPSR